MTDIENSYKMISHYVNVHVYYVNYWQNGREREKTYRLSACNIPKIPALCAAYFMIYTRYKKVRSHTEKE